MLPSVAGQLPSYARLVESRADGRLREPARPTSVRIADHLLAAAPENPVYIDSPGP
jgi:hypothetical protein